jgi:hypothetical protein
MTICKQAARHWPSLYGDFRQGFLSSLEVANTLWRYGYSANEARDIADAWDDELNREEVVADYRIASRS